ncbi:MAG TPA: hypothetical protein VKH82_00600 [Candidatus Binatia bacterium]|nr:hypothetical protein [Candidatus Binatia bacterium]
MLGPQLGGVEMDALGEVLDAAVLAEGQRRAGVLLVGDCLYLDIITFAQPALTAEGITLDPTFLTSKNPIQLRREITALDPASARGTRSCSAAARSTPIRPGSRSTRRRPPTRRAASAG